MLLDALEILLSGAYDDSEDDNPDDFSHALMLCWSTTTTYRLIVIG